MSSSNVSLALIAIAFVLASCSRSERPRFGSAISAPENHRVETPASAARLLTKDLSSASEVQFYFLTRTGDYSLNPSDFKKVSTIRIYRACGGNCARFMEPVIEHLKNSVRHKCQDGQEDALVEFAQNEMIVYSYSGRIARYRGNCFLNKESIHEILRSSPFYFERS